MEKINAADQSLSLLRMSKKKPKTKTFVFILQLTFVLGLLAVWLSSKGIQQSKNLWILFFYCFPAEFLIAVVPHEPLLLYFGKFYSPLTVALVSIAGTVLTEATNYSVFRYITDIGFFQKLRQRKFMGQIVDFFNRAPFVSLLVAGFSPIPFYPFRFLVVLAHYPLWKYLLAVFLSRTPRFILIAWVGYRFNIPDYLLVVLFLVLIISANFPIVTKFIKSKKKGGADAE